MIDQDKNEPARPEGLPTELHNDEQDGHGEQAQDVAEDARREDSRTSSPLESTKAPSNDYDPAPDSKADLIDEMRRMEGEGRIDMSAYAGEPNHDDEPGTYGGETTDDHDEEWQAPGEGDPVEIPVPDDDDALGDEEE